MLLGLGHLQLQCHYSQFRLLNIVALGHATSFEPWSCDPTIYVIWVERIVNILQKYDFGNRTRTERVNRTLIPIKVVSKEIRDGDISEKYFVGLFAPDDANNRIHIIHNIIRGSDTRVIISKNI